MVLQAAYLFFCSYHWTNMLCLTKIIIFYDYNFCFFCYQHLFYFFHTQHHNTISIQNKQTKHNKTTNIYSLFQKSNHKGEREGEKHNKSFLYIITYIRGKTLPSLNSGRLGPINSRCCTFTSHYLQEATDPICFSTHVWHIPVLYYCLLCCRKTSKQHSLLY